MIDHPTLYPWDSGPAVAELQELLCAHGYKLKIDSNFGYITEAAVKAFQKHHGLRIDGVVGVQTWAWLMQEIKSGVRVLRQGHRGADVHDLQGLLKLYGFGTPRDGVFGPDTKQAVLEFQKAHKLWQDGVVGPITWTVLREGKPLPCPPEKRDWYINQRRWW
ncbi:MAG: peptidoglycan-binding protein [Leptolyngbyaceae cyanobacterium bins.59]|nr:peptidoglycan-binding protein [Leptolyngbyaceae cyanobacterium bins.59]